MTIVFGVRDLAGAARQVLPHRRLKVVDVVEEHLLDFAGRRLDVARQRDVDDEERAIAARAHDRFDARLRQDRRGRAGRGDDDVAAAERGVHSSHGAAVAPPMASAVRAA